MPIRKPLPKKSSSIGTKIRKYFGMGVTKPKTIKSAEEGVRSIKEHGNKLPTQAGKPRIKLKKKKKED